MLCIVSFSVSSRNVCLVGGFGWCCRVGTLYIVLLLVVCGCGLGLIW